MTKKNEKEKMAISISFKKNEKELYDKLKAIPSYGQLIKELLSKYLYEEQHTEPVNNKVDDGKILLSVNDICQLIESATKNITVAIPGATVSTTSNEISMVDSKSTITPPKESNGEFDHLMKNDLDDSLLDSLG